MLAIQETIISKIVRTCMINRPMILPFPSLILSQRNTKRKEIIILSIRLALFVAFERKEIILSSKVVGRSPIKIEMGEGEKKKRKVSTTRADDTVNNIHSPSIHEEGNL